MRVDKLEACFHIRSVLIRQEAAFETEKLWNFTYDVEVELTTLYANTFARLCPRSAPHFTEYQNALQSEAVHIALQRTYGCLKALLADYENDRIQHYEQIVTQAVFENFLDMAKYLIDNERLKDPAAVLASGVLEQHLRKLCQINNINPAPPMMDGMNTELRKKGVYTQLMQKQITAWAGLRNHAAHGHYDQYTLEQVRLMIEGVEHFMANYPA